MSTQLTTKSRLLCLVITEFPSSSLDLVLCFSLIIIIPTVDDMSTRIDDLEKNIFDVMQTVGIEDVTGFGDEKK